MKILAVCLPQRPLSRSLWNSVWSPIISSGRKNVQKKYKVLWLILLFFSVVLSWKMKQNETQEIELKIRINTPPVNWPCMLRPRVKNHWKEQIWLKSVMHVWAEVNLGLLFLFACIKVRTFFPGETLELRVFGVSHHGWYSKFFTSIYRMDTEKSGEIPVNNDILSPNQGVPMKTHPGFLGVLCSLLSLKQWSVWNVILKRTSRPVTIICLHIHTRTPPRPRSRYGLFAHVQALPRAPVLWGQFSESQMYLAVRWSFPTQEKIPELGTPELIQELLTQVSIFPSRERGFHCSDTQTDPLGERRQRSPLDHCGMEAQGSRPAGDFVIREGSILRSFGKLFSYALNQVPSAVFLGSLEHAKTWKYSWSVSFLSTWAVRRKSHSWRFV